MTFAYTWGGNQDRVTTFANEVSDSRFKDRLLSDAAIELEVELIERISVTAACRFGVTSDLAITAHDQPPSPLISSIGMHGDEGFDRASIADCSIRRAPCLTISSKGLR